MKIIKKRFKYNHFKLVVIILLKNGNFLKGYSGQDGYPC